MPETIDPQMPVRRAEEPDFLTRTRFDAFDLPAEVMTGLNDIGFTYCTPIQAQVLPLSLTGKDVAGQAQTGTGKTAAFLVTIFTRLLTLPRREDGLPSVLIVAPTRELALQIFEEAEILGRHTGLSLAQVVGGVDYRKQAEILRGGTDVVICTPGRIIDYFKQGIFKTTNIQIVVIDEADRLLDLGFAKDMRYILRKLPHYESRQSMLFSATLSYRVLELTYDYMNLPEFVSVTPEEVILEGIEQSLFHIGTEHKLPLLLGLLTREDWNRILIFVNTRVGVDRLAKKLKGNGWPAEGITGDLPQRKRFGLMEGFKDGRIKILVATDVASRGIHVEDISHVINYDLPQDAENYIHRIGRTARAGKTGRAISLACERYVFHLEPIEEILGYKIPIIWPEDDWFVEDKSKKIPAERKQWRKKPVRRPRSDAKKKRPTEKKAEEKKSKKVETGSFPGAFFGFAPEPNPQENSEPLLKQKESTGKKRRRRTRKKGHGPDGDGTNPSKPGR